MWVKRMKYKTMEGEDHLGYQIEEELIYEEDEIKDALIQYIKDNNEIPTVLNFIDDYTDEDIEIEVAEYF